MGVFAKDHLWQNMMTCKEDGLILNLKHQCFSSILTTTQIGIGGGISTVNGINYPWKKCDLSRPHSVYRWCQSSDTPLVEMLQCLVVDSPPLSSHLLTFVVYH